MIQQLTKIVKLDLNNEAALIIAFCIVFAGVAILASVYWQTDGT